MLEIPGSGPFLRALPIILPKGKMRPVNCINKWAFANP
jgi:hypothetical protein